MTWWKNFVAFCGLKSRIVAENGKNRDSARAAISFWPCRECCQSDTLTIEINMVKAFGQVFCVTLTVMAHIRVYKDMWKCQVDISWADRWSSHFIVVAVVSFLIINFQTYNSLRVEKSPSIKRVYLYLLDHQWHNKATWTKQWRKRWRVYRNTEGPLGVLLWRTVK